MGDMMAKAIFIREFHWTRPRGLGFGARPSPEPQAFPQDFIDAAIAAGAALPPAPKPEARRSGGRSMKET